MIRKVFASFFLFLTLWSFEASADGSLGFLYTRSDITITRNRLPTPLPWLKEPPPNHAITFDVEVRDAANVYNPNIPGGQTGWYNLSSPADNHGVMIVFKTLTMAPISHSTEYAPLDVVWIDHEGKILQILPNLKLSELDHDIIPEKPVLAFLFLKGGITKQTSINPGDKVEGGLFNQPTVIINTDKAKVETTPSTLTPPSPMMPDVRTLPFKVRATE